MIEEELRGAASRISSVRLHVHHHDGHAGRLGKTEISATFADGNVICSEIREQVEEDLERRECKGEEGRLATSTWSTCVFE